MEAARCLGELGTGDLTTMVLQTEAVTANVSCSALEFFTTDIIKLLLRYAKDPDINVVQAVSETLKKVMESKEARNIAGFDNNTCSSVFCAIGKLLQIQRRKTMI